MSASSLMQCAPLLTPCWTHTWSYYGNWQMSMPSHATEHSQALVQWWRNSAVAAVVWNYQPLWSSTGLQLKPTIKKWISLGILRTCKTRKVFQQWWVNHPFNVFAFLNLVYVISMSLWTINAFIESLLGAHVIFVRVLFSVSFVSATMLFHTDIPALLNFDCNFQCKKKKKILTKTMSS